MVKLPKGFKEVGEKRLRGYQRNTVAFGINKGSCGLLLDMGCGKTLCAINLARYHIQFNEVKKILVACPASLPLKWQESIKESSEYKAIILPPTRKKRVQTALTNKEKFHIINYESLWPLIRDVGDKACEKLGYDMIIFDESGKFLKNPTSRISKCCMDLSDYAKYKLILTGTLIGNHPLNLWVQFYCLDGGKSLGINYKSFETSFFYKSTNNNTTRLYLKKKFIEPFRRVIQKNCIRYTREEVLPELPAIIEDKIEIKLNTTLTNEYNLLKKGIISELETEMKKKKLNSFNVFERLIRLQQFTSGFISTGKGTEKKLKETPKLNALIEEVETIINNEESAVIWCKFSYTIDMIAEKLKKFDVLILDGRISNKNQKYSIWREFQKSNSKNILIVQSESGGFGIELFKENPKEKAKHEHSIIYENTWSPDTREQLKARILRGGLKSACRVADIVVKDTIDERILDVLKKKKEIADMIEKVGIKQFLG